MEQGGKWVNFGLFFRIRRLFTNFCPHVWTRITDTLLKNRWCASGSGVGVIALYLVSALGLLVYAVHTLWGCFSRMGVLWSGHATGGTFLDTFA